MYNIFSINWAGVKHYLVEYEDGEVYWSLSALKQACKPKKIAFPKEGQSIPLRIYMNNRKAVKWIDYLVCMISNLHVLPKSLQENLKAILQNGEPPDLSQKKKEFKTASEAQADARRQEEKKKKKQQTHPNLPEEIKRDSREERGPEFGFAEPDFEDGALDNLPPYIEELLHGTPDEKEKEAEKEEIMTEQEIEKEQQENREAENEPQPPQQDTSNPLKKETPKGKQEKLTHPRIRESMNSKDQAWRNYRDPSTIPRPFRCSVQPLHQKAYFLDATRCCRENLGPLPGNQIPKCFPKSLENPHICQYTQETRCLLCPIEAPPSLEEVSLAKKTKTFSSLFPDKAVQASLGRTYFTIPFQVLDPSKSGNLGTVKERLFFAENWLNGRLDQLRPGLPREPSLDSKDNMPSTVLELIQLYAKISPEKTVEAIFKIKPSKNSIPFIIQLENIWKELSKTPEDVFLLRMDLNMSKRDYESWFLSLYQGDPTVLLPFPSDVCPCLNSLFCLPSKITKIITNSSIFRHICF